MKVLIVDDEPLIGQEIADYLSLHDYECLHCCDCNQALDSLQQNPDIRIVVTDLRMPGRSGFELIDAAREQAQFAKHSIEFIVITGHGGKNEAIDALRTGVCEFLPKPLKQSELLAAIKKAESEVLKRDTQQKVKKKLHLRVLKDGQRIDQLMGSLDSAYAELTYCLATASEHKDPETGKHIFRMGEYAALMGSLMGWSETEIAMIRLAAPLHDVGKIGTPDSVLLKPGKLTDFELKIMQQHPIVGYNILSCATSHVLKMAANIALNHHERWDGSGYPKGLSGHRIPMEAAITSLADVYDALRSERPYKPEIDHDTVRRIILEGDGRTEPDHWSEEIMRLFDAHHYKFNEIYESMRDRVSNGN